MASITKNATLCKGKTLSPVESFTNARVRPRLDTFHPIGLPCNVIQNDLQAGKKIGKWLPRARLGIYLGISPRHAHTVALVLNPRTGLTSPQFHVKCDDLFETVRGTVDVPEHGEWQSKCGFKKAMKHNNTGPMPQIHATLPFTVSTQSEGADRPVNFGFDPDIPVPLLEPPQLEGEQQA